MPNPGPEVREAVRQMGNELLKAKCGDGREGSMVRGGESFKLAELEEGAMALRADGDWKEEG